MKLNDQDRRALRALDADVTLNDSNEAAVITGRMEVEITRFDEQFRLRFIFPSAEELTVRIARAQLLEQLDIGDDKS